MRNSAYKFLGVIMLLLIGAGAYAQPPDRDRDDRYRTFGREPLDRVRADLDRAERRLSYLSEEEMRRFRRVRVRVAEFQQQWERGRFDREVLDEVIGSMRWLLEKTRIRPGDRDILREDLERLRDLRERHERGFRR